MPRGRKCRCGCPGSTRSTPSARGSCRRGCHQLRIRGVKRFVRQTLLGGLGNSEIDDFGNREAVMHGDHDVRRLEVPMNDSLLMGMLDPVADLDEQLQPFLHADAS